MDGMRINRMWVGLSLAMAAVCGAYGQALPTKEYIYLNGRLVAVETKATIVAPALTSLTPTTGSGSAGTFTAVYSDANGGADIARAELHVTPTGGTVANGCLARYVTQSGKLELMDDAGVTPVGTLTPGGAGSLSNSRCTLNATGSSAATSGQTVTVVFPLTYAVAFAGAKDVKLAATDSTSLSAGPSAMGVWTVPDTTAPVISGQMATVGDTSATIVWTTNEAADSQVEYGTTTAYGSQTALDTTLTVSHSVTLSGLPMATLYYVRVKSKDAAGNAAAPALLQFTTTAPACSLSPVSATLPNAGGTASVTVNCVAGLGWTSSVNGASWASVTPGTGTGPVTVSVAAANANGAAQRTATLTIAGQSFSLTQRGGSVLSLTPPTASAAHDQSVDFHASVDGIPSDCTVTWTLTPAVGTISNCGLYTAPSVILASQTSVTVTAKDPLNNGTGTAALTLTPYAPPGALSVTPSSGAAASAVLTFVVNDANGGSGVTEIQMLVHTTNGDALNACYLQVRPGSAEYPPNAIYLGVNSGTGWYGPISAGTAGAVLYNSQCQVNVANSTVTVSGTTVSVALDLYFKPGFTGMKNIYMKAANSTGASTYWTQVGTRDLTANPAALIPTMEVTAPAAGATVAGVVNVTGSALDNATRSENDITSVAVYVDNVFQGYATLGQASTKCNTYPGRPGCPNVGYTYALNTGLITNGTHTLKVVATDFDVPAHTAEDIRTITVNNIVPLAVVVTPANPYVRETGSSIPVDTRQFTATVGGTPSTAVNWSLTPVWPNTTTYQGSITTGGLYTGPTAWAGTGVKVTVTATRQANPSDVGSTTVTLMGLLSPEFQSLSPGQTAYCYSSLGSVTYTLSPNIGTVTAPGIYTPPASYTPGTAVTITAIATADPTMRQQSIVVLQ